jgi:hypothetical protein
MIYHFEPRTTGTVLLPLLWGAGPMATLLSEHDGYTTGTVSNKAMDIAVVAAVMQLTARTASISRQPRTASAACVQT